MRFNGSAAVGILIALLLPCWAVTGVATRYVREADFNTVKAGDSYGAVLQKMGNPSSIDAQGETLLRYTPEPCLAPCVKRLWYENRLMLDLEAWSISVDSSGKVVDKYQWMSP